MDGGILSEAVEYTYKIVRNWATYKKINANERRAVKSRNQTGTCTPDLAMNSDDASGINVFVCFNGNNKSTTEVVRSVQKIKRA